MAGRVVLTSVAMDAPTPAPPPGAAAPPSPEAMRTAMAEYVRAVHQAYLDAAEPLPPAERARLPLIAAGSVTVLAVGARNLHVLATTEQLPAPEGQEVQLSDSLGDLSWTLRFFDPVIVPSLGLVDESAEPQPLAVREVLGVRTVVYHVTVPPGGGLSPHHALHAGTGLAHSHAAAHRDFESISALAPASTDLVAEMRGAAVAGLTAAQVLLAREIAPTSRELAELPVTGTAGEDVRRTLLLALRRSTP
jgi:hypothetical protein